MRSRISDGRSEIWEKRTTVTVSSIVDLAAVDLLEEVHHLVEAAELRVVVLDVARGQLLRLLDLHRSITASKIRSRGECWKPTVISTTSPLRYFLLLSPRRIVAVLRPRLSWSTKIGE